MDLGVNDPMQIFLGASLGVKLPYPSRAEAIQLCPVLLTPDDGLAGHPEVCPRPEHRPLASPNGGLGRGCLQ